MGKILIIRVKEKGARGDKCYEYKNDINILDPNALSMVFNDLRQVFNAPIEKAMEISKTRKDKIFPFLEKN